jgi:hypothetical protein
MLEVLCCKACLLRIAQCHSGFDIRTNRLCRVQLHYRQCKTTRDNAETRPGISSEVCCGYKAKYKCECEATENETECETECETETKTEASLQASLQRRVVRGAFSLEERMRRELEGGSESRRGPVGVRVKGGKGALWVAWVSGLGRGAGSGLGLVVQRRPV